MYLPRCSDVVADDRGRLLLQHRRITAAVGTVVFGLFSKVGALPPRPLLGRLLFIPAALLPGDCRTGRTGDRSPAAGQPVALVADLNDSEALEPRPRVAEPVGRTPSCRGSTGTIEQSLRLSSPLPCSEGAAGLERPAEAAGQGRRAACCVVLGARDMLFTRAGRSYQNGAVASGIASRREAR